MFFEAPTTPVIVTIVVAILGSGSLGTFAGYLLFRRKNNAEADALEITNDLSEGQARKKLLADMDGLAAKLTAVTAERDTAVADLRVKRNLLTAAENDVEYLREQTKKFWIAEGGCLERERMNSQAIADMQQKHAQEIADMKRAFEMEIEDIKAQLKEALIFKEKNQELAEENARILAENEELKKKDE